MMNFELWQLFFILICVNYDVKKFALAYFIINNLQADAEIQTLGSSYIRIQRAEENALTGPQQNAGPHQDRTGNTNHADAD